MQEKRAVLINKFLIWVLIPIFLFTTWLTLSITYLVNYIVYKDYSFSVLSHNHRAIEKPEINQHLIKGEITAKDKYLGILIIRFDRQNTTLNTKINFRIKEKGKKDWYHTLSTNTIHIRYLPLFPFGFPVIENSQGKRYVYEVEIIKKNPYNSLALSSEMPQLISKYQYPKDLLLKDRPLLISFLINKMSYILVNSYFALISFIYFLPFLLYMFLLVLPEKIVQKIIPSSLKKLFKTYLPLTAENSNGLIFLTLFLLSDIFFVPVRSDLLVLIFLGIWTFFIKKYRFAPHVSFFIANFFFMLSAFLFIFFLPKNSEKAAIWGIFFLTSGTVHYVMSILQQKKVSKL